jgi:hypothetical protein
MLSADRRAAKALKEPRAEETGGQDGNIGQGQLLPQAPLPQPKHRLLRRFALLLVTAGGRLVGYGLPPHDPGEQSARGESSRSSA